MIYSLSSSINQLFCISYSLSRDKGSEAVKSCNSGDFIHSWYLQKKWYETPVVNNSSSSSSSISSSSSSSSNSNSLLSAAIIPIRPITETAQEDKYSRNTMHVECKNRTDTSSNRSKWNQRQSLRKYLSNIIR